MANVLPLRSSRLATILAKSKLFKTRMLYSTMHQKLKVLKMALVLLDAASDMAVCGEMHFTKNLTSYIHTESKV